MGLMRSERTATGTSRPFSELLDDPCAARMRYHLNATPGCGPCSVHFPSSIFHLRNRKNIEKAAISCVFEVYR